MNQLSRRLDEYITLVEAGKTIEAMERFYADDVLMFENRELARAGRTACIEHERAQLGGNAEPASLRATKRAANPAAGVCFIEWVIRFHSPDGRPMRLEEVAVQRWNETGITEERFYYDGAIDEGDEDRDENEDDLVPM